MEKAEVRPQPALLPESPSMGQGLWPLSAVERLTRESGPPRPLGSRGPESRLIPPAPGRGLPLSPVVTRRAAPHRKSSGSPFPPEQQQRPLENSRFRSRLVESSTEETSLVSLVLAGRWHPGAWDGGGCLPTKAEAASGVKVENLTGAATWTRAQASTCPLAPKEAISISLEARLPGITRWQLLTERGPPVEEVGHHLAFALDLDHTPALQLVCVGSQHLVHVRGDLRGQRRRKDRSWLSRESGDRWLCQTVPTTDGGQGLPGTDSCSYCLSETRRVAAPTPCQAVWPATHLCYFCCSKCGSWSLNCLSLSPLRSAEAGRKCSGASIAI